MKAPPVEVVLHSPPKAWQWPVARSSLPRKPKSMKVSVYEGEAAEKRWCYGPSDSDDIWNTAEKYGARTLG